MLKPSISTERWLFPFIAIVNPPKAAKEISPHVVNSIMPPRCYVLHSCSHFLGMEMASGCSPGDIKDSSMVGLFDHRVAKNHWFILIFLMVFQCPISRPKSVVNLPRIPSNRNSYESNGISDIVSPCGIGIFNILGCSTLNSFSLSLSPLNLICNLLHSYWKWPSRNICFCSNQNRWSSIVL